MRRNLAIIVALLCVLCALPVVSGSAPQFFSGDLTIQQTETTTGGRGAARNITVTTYMSGNAMKNARSDGMDTIVRLEQGGKVIMVDNGKKTYSEITFQELQAAVDQAGAAMGQMPPEAMAMMKKMMGGGGATEVSVTKVGPGETIAGYATEKFVVKGPMATEVWAATTLKVPPQYYDALKLQMPKNPMFDLGKQFEAMKKIGGIPLKQVTTMRMMGSETTTTIVATSVDKGTIPPATFAVPAGYKKVAAQ